MALFRSVLMTLVLLFVLIIQPTAKEKNACITHKDLVQQVFDLVKTQDNKAPEFRIKEADDGQSLIYWHLGGETGSFFAATFKSNGCAILTPSGELRRLTFPKTAFNTGVFFEMDVLETGF